MQRFRRYITSMQDRDELLLSAIDSICREKRRLHQLRYKVLPERVQVKRSEFENRVSRFVSPSFFQISDKFFSRIGQTDACSGCRSFLKLAALPET